MRLLSDRTFLSCNIFKFITNNQQFPDYIDGFDKRIRVRQELEVISKKKKDIKYFSVGLEIEINNKWVTIVRHCRWHEDEGITFHTHNEFKLPILGNNERIINYKTKQKTLGSQMRWAIRNIVGNYHVYKKQYLKCIKK